MIVAVLALCVAVGGSASAAVLITSANIKNGTIRGRDVHRHTLSKAKFTAKAAAALKGKPGKAGKPGTDGKDGADGAPGSARGFATVSSAGNVDEAHAANVTDANVTKVGNFICFNGLSFTPKLVVANVDSNFGVGYSVQTNAGGSGGSAVCPGNEQASAVQVNATGATQPPVPMHIALY